MIVKGEVRSDTEHLLLAQASFDYSVADEPDLDMAINLMKHIQDSSLPSILGELRLLHPASK